ncbi:hypothetical protein [Antarctobacter sp.]|uniref:hypothetical protein n=1 Tax=Antarctobacter sp. TaxID=1872577 RepID=UPI002B26D330|nr:hypothetical protein [Antarctobacter sp.]
MLRPFLISCLLASPVAAQEVEILPGYSDFRQPETRVVRRPISLFEDWMSGFPESGEGAPSLDLSAGFQGDRLVMVLTLGGGGDDSVSAVQRRIEFIQVENLSWAVMAYGFRQKCHRGGSDDWTGKPCP